MQLHAFWCCSRIRQKPRRPCRWSARLREFFRRTCCPSTNPLAVRRSCPREIQRTSARQCNTPPTGGRSRIRQKPPRPHPQEIQRTSALENKTGRAAMQFHACRCRSRIRQKTRHPCCCPARPPLRDFPPCPLLSGKPACSAPLVSAGDAAHTALENKTGRAAMQLHACRCCLRIRQKIRRPCCWSACPPPQDFPPYLLPFDKPACCAPLVSAGDSANVRA